MPPKNKGIVVGDMATYSSDIDHDDLPELSAILAPRALMATSGNANLRRSPRKKGSTVQNLTQSPQKKEKRQAERPGRAKASETAVDGIPVLPRNVGKTNANVTATSNNRQSPEVTRAQRPWPLPHLDSLLLPSTLQIKRDKGASNVDQWNSILSAGTSSSLRLMDSDNQSIMALMTEAGRHQEETRLQSTQKNKGQVANRASRFILHEARCNDDLENSQDEQDEDEETDLSGFIVDDDAELSYHDWSNSDSDSNFSPGDDGRPLKLQGTKPRRRLVRGSPTRRKLSFVDNNSESGNESDREDERGSEDPDGLTNAFTNLGLQEETSEINTLNDAEVEVVDLTSSPSISPRLRLDSMKQPISTHRPNTSHKRSNPPSDLSNLLDDFDKALTLAPPIAPAVLKIPSKTSASHTISAMEDDKEVETKDQFHTPPATPPQSPAKLKSPSKLLSPSKRQMIPRSPHRQSMDAFWDHNVINEWNDEYSPKKEPAKSPRKGLEQFQIWTDSEVDDYSDIEKYFLDDSNDSLPSPVSRSPRKIQLPRSPIRSPEKEERRRVAEQNRARVAAKKAFESQREEMAMSLFNELDTNVADSQLSTLASSTGGVKIIWSRTLRSTAGRANWKRTVNKASGSPIKGEGSKYEGVPGVSVQHFASIELAEKIIDREDRLVNTLAHEFCHLTNFMISGVRDNPHGASFKEWAAKVTNHLRNSNTGNPVWRQVQVTTKHSYAIDHKYLWICSGRDKTQAMEILNIADGDDDNQGCGAEYGRHSKSIDTAKQRCGRCRGVLLQVRPKPRAAAGFGSSPRKKRDVKKVGRAVSDGTDSSSSGGQGGRSQSSTSSTTTTTTTMSESMIEVIELSD